MLIKYYFTVESSWVLPISVVGIGRSWLEVLVEGVELVGVELSCELARVGLLRELTK